VPNIEPELHLPLALTAPPPRPSPMPTAEIMMWTPRTVVAAMCRFLMRAGRTVVPANRAQNPPLWDSE
jgi:hypothetical protein